MEHLQTRTIVQDHTVEFYQNSQETGIWIESFPGGSLGNIYTAVLQDQNHLGYWNEMAKCKMQYNKQL